MNIKTFMTASVFALATASVAQAADIMISRQSTELVPPVVVAPTFSWTGFYFGAQTGGFSSKTGMSISHNGKINQIRKNDLPKLSGFVGGLYAGYNVGLGNTVVLGVDTDVVWAGKKNTTIVQKTKVTVDNINHFEQILKNANIQINSNDIAANDILVLESSFKEKWSGATRVRFGFATDRIMPYVAGGIAYARFQDIVPVTLKESDPGKVVVSGKLSDETKTMIGYTLGAGLDFAMTDNVLLRAEYRYSDFGKKKFAKDRRNIEYKTNNFRIGVAYKF
ncbi:outer membrane protein [Bartonella sp. F02]|uniref:outer membrane protein n=1 Tax=Bartonella sp. F02 TaxID=2967262 RepID=UPI0022A98260|nr:outer membrane protein [Bartonella sp. F02]MCZ2328092.1 porin family protein [Bartonella sp. F02]